MRQMVTMSSHKGIPSYSVDRGGIFTGSLLFGVGFRNEPVTLAGITHLVEHAVLRMVQPVTLWHGGAVQMDSVEFYACGDADAVAGYLNAIAGAVSGFTAVGEEELALEKSIMEAENPQGFSTVSSGLLTCRFGTNGQGAGHFGSPTITGISRAEAIEWAQRWLTNTMVRADDGSRNASPRSWGWPGRTRPRSIEGGLIRGFVEEAPGPW